MAKAKDIRVLLLRTGETEWERAGRIGGAADVPLSLAGFETVRRRVQELGGARVATVFCGPDEASVATASELAGSTGAKVKVIDELGEIHLGLWEGLLESELEGRCPTAYRQWLENPGCIQAPEGESLDDAQDRIMKAVGRSLKGSKTDNGAVAFVLRPVAMALVGCAVGGCAKRNVWSMLESSPQAQWHTLPRDLGTSGHRQGARAGA
ncbi:MAG: histidine phosphatase family protein [Phycisphaerales bacterium]